MYKNSCKNVSKRKYDSVRQSFISTYISNLSYTFLSVLVFDLRHSGLVSDTVKSECGWS